jgi:hypothetical protein
MSTQTISSIRVWYPTRESLADVEGTWTDTDFDQDIQTKYLTAIAEAWALFIQSKDPNICLAASASGVLVA